MTLPVVSIPQPKTATLKGKVWRQLVYLKILKWAPLPEDLRQGQANSRTWA